MPTFTHLSILTKPALALLGQALLTPPTQAKFDILPITSIYAKVSIKQKTFLSIRMI